MENAGRRGVADRTGLVTMDGGALKITGQENGDVLRTGPATTVFHGKLP